VLHNDAMQDDEIIDIAVSYDGTWHTRGHRSLYGIGVVVEITTGLVVDYEILSKYCHMCSIQKAELGESSDDYKAWYKTHKESNECQVSYGSQNYFSCSYIVR